MNEQAVSKEIARVREVADMMVTIHAALRSRYQNLALISDCGLFACSLGLSIIAFMEPNQLLRYSRFLSPLNIALFSAFILLYSVIASSLDWRKKSYKHNEACKVFLDFKLRAKELRDKSARDEQTEAVFLTEYRAATHGLIPISDSDFLSFKKQHKLKVFISAYLDDHPGTWIWLLRLKLWFWDNRSCPNKANE